METVNDLHDDLMLQFGHGVGAVENQFSAKSPCGTFPA